MHRRQFIAAVGAVGTFSAVVPVDSPLAAASNAAAVAAGASLIKGTPVVFAPVADGFTVTVALNAPALVRVEYGETAALGAVARSDSCGFVPHDDVAVKIRLRGLRPGERYHWRVVAGPLSAGARKGAVERTATYVTRTLAPTAGETRFGVWNDTHDRAETIQRLHEGRGEGDDFLLWNGDVSNDVNRREILPGLYVCPKGVDLAEGAPVFFVRGNHDVRGIWANKMTDFVDFPEGRPFYAFRSGPLGVVVLDTGEDKPDAHPSFKGVAAFEDLIREQAVWLGRAIASPELRDAPCRVVFCHIPLRWHKEARPDYARGGYDWVSLRGREAWGGVLRQWGAQVVVSGHTHRAAWLPPSGEWPFGQLVGGGPRLDVATRIRGHATGRELRLVMERVVDGTVLHALSFPSVC
ncbi:MAG: metallophosphoesterase [Puniceicoccales bacterium]|jgi:predicted phosphodiesterase|nr:metallophosphoesterase [Puniceicoccales bacterium]